MKKRTLEKFLSLMGAALIIVGCAKEQPYDEVFREPEIVNKESSADTKSLHLAQVTTVDVPTKAKSMRPFMDGEAKLVKMRWEKEGLKLYEVELDPQLTGNTLNEYPILTIPGQYKSYRCAEDDLGECTNKEEENTELTWDQKDFFYPDFDKIKETQTNILSLYNESDSCLTPDGQKMIQYEMKAGVLSVLIEKNFKMSNKISCWIRHFRGRTSDDTMKVRYLYSAVRLDDISSPDYEPIDYPKQDHNDFGFFKSEKKDIGINGDRSRPVITYKLNRWNPKKKELVYYLSDNFNKESNLYLKEATIRATERINESLKRSNTGVKIVLKESKKGMVPGDLRHSHIILVDDPIASGLLGYGPTNKNPFTGEIVQGKVVMYPGVLQQLTKKAYDHMVDLSIQKKLAEIRAQQQKPQPNPAPEPPEEEESHEHNHDHDHAGHAHTKKFSPENFKRQRAVENILRNAKNYKSDADILAQIDSKLAESSDRVRNLVETQRNRKVDVLGSSTNSLRGHGALLKAMEVSGDLEDFLTFMDNKEGAELIHHQALLDYYSKNNAYHKDFFNWSGLAKTEFEGISNIPGIKENGILKPWNRLSKSQIEAVTKIVMVNAYTSTFIHEFGHNLGLRHNFMGSQDKENFWSTDELKKLGLKRLPPYSSVMDYAYSELNELTTFGRYDEAALRFAYAREVEVVTADQKPELGKGKFERVSGPLHKHTVKAPDASVKRYQFCTDENAGTSVDCLRFDEGATYVEKAQHFIEDYKRVYKIRNFRNDREEFKNYDVIPYMVGTLRRFGNMRLMQDMYEQIENIVGPEIMAQGCNDAQRSNPANEFICNLIDDVSQSTAMIGQFLLEVVKTPDHVCAITTETGGIRLTPLSTLFAEVRRSINYVPKTCFDPAIMRSVEAPAQIVAETGKFLNDQRANDPRHTYTNDIHVRGVWSDKIFAMMTLQDRLGRTSTDNIPKSFLDIPIIKAEYDNWVEHVMMGEEVINPVPFRTADGRLVNVSHDLLSGTNEKVRGFFMGGLNRFLQLNRNTDTNLNQSLMFNAFRENYVVRDDPDFKESIRNEVNKISVRRYRIDESVEVNENAQEIVVDRFVYYAPPANTLAHKTLTYHNNFLDLKKITDELGNNDIVVSTLKEKEEAQAKVLAEVAKPFDKNMLTIIQTPFEGSMVEESAIEGFINTLKRIGKQDPNNFPDPVLKAVVTLHVEGLEKFLEILKTQGGLASIREKIDGADKLPALTKEQLCKVSSIVEGEGEQAQVTLEDKKLLDQENENCEKKRKVLASINKVREGEIKKDLIEKYLNNGLSPLVTNEDILKQNIEIMPVFN